MEDVRLSGREREKTDSKHANENAYVVSERRR